MANLLHWLVILILLFTALSTLLYLREAQISTTADEALISQEKLAISVEIGAGPYYTGQPIPLELKLSGSNILRGRELALELKSDSSRSVFLDEDSRAIIGNAITFSKGERKIKLNYLDFHADDTLLSFSGTNLESVSVPLTIVNAQASLATQPLVTQQLSYRVGQVYTTQLRFNQEINLDELQIITNNPKFEWSLTSSRKATAEHTLEFSSEKSGETVIVFYHKKEQLYYPAIARYLFEPSEPTTILLKNQDYQRLKLNQWHELNFIVLDRYSNYANIPTLDFNVTSSDPRLKLRVSADGASYMATNLPDILTIAREKDHFRLMIMPQSIGKQEVQLFDDDRNLNLKLEYTAVDATFSASLSEIVAYTDDPHLGQPTLVRVFTVDSATTPLANQEISLKVEPSSDVHIDPKTVFTDENGMADFMVGFKQASSFNLQAHNQTADTTLSKQLQFNAASQSTAKKWLQVLRNNSELRLVAETVAIPYLNWGLIIAAIVLVFNFLSLIHWGISYLCQAVKRWWMVALDKDVNAWGVVVDNFTGQVLADARVHIYSHAARDLVDSTRTNSQGEFSFNVPAGRYHITASKDGFVFPATFFADLSLTHKSIHRYDRYLGQDFIIMDNDPRPNLTIPLEPKMINWTASLKLRYFIATLINWLEIVARQIFTPLIIVSILVALAVLAVYVPSYNAFLVLILYCILLLLNQIVHNISMGHLGFVYDGRTEQPIKNAVLRIKDKKLHMYRANIITNIDGSFSLYLPKGDYDIEVDPPYQLALNANVDKKHYSVLTATHFRQHKSGYFNKDIFLSVK